MTAFNASLNVIATSINVPDDESLSQGAPPSVEIHLEVGMTLPFSQGPGQPPISGHLGTLRFVMPSDKALEFFKSGVEAAEKLPAPSNLMIASDVSAVEEAAKKMESIIKP